MEELQTSNIQLQNNFQIRNANIQNGRVYDLRERLMIFSGRIISICKLLPKCSESEVIKKQLARSGTSVGANFEEADGALTKKDFVNKVAIARKEAKEAKYWLRVVSQNFISGAMIEAEIGEVEEIICILSAILRKSGYRFRY